MRALFASVVVSAGLLLSGGGAFARDFIVLATPQAPFKYEEGGRLKGIDADVLKLVMKRLGQPYKVRLIRSGTRVLAEAAEGRADMLLLFSRKASRLELLDYPQESYVDLTWHFFVRAKDRARIHFREFADLRTLRVGATKDYSYTREFWQAGLDLQIISNNDLQMRKLVSGRIDVVPLNTIATLYEAKRQGILDEITFLPRPMKAKSYYNVFPKASTHPNRAAILAQYDRVIADLKHEGEIESIFARYLGPEYAENVKSLSY